MIKLIDKEIVINGKYIRIRGKGFIQAIRRLNLLTQKNHGKFL